MGADAAEPPAAHPRRPAAACCFLPTADLPYARISCPPSTRSEMPVM